MVPLCNVLPVSQSCDFAELPTYHCVACQAVRVVVSCIAINMPAIFRMATPATIHSTGGRHLLGCATLTARTRMLHKSRDLEEQVAAVTVIRRIST